MNVLVNILSVVYVLCCIFIIVLVLLQKSEQGGASESIMGTTANNFYEKNKGRTREGKLKRSTILFSVLFVFFFSGIIYQYFVLYIQTLKFI